MPLQQISTTNSNPNHTNPNPKPQFPPHFVQIICCLSQMHNQK